MNIYPSDTDVRQGLTPVTGAASPPTGGNSAPSKTASASAAAEAQELGTSSTLISDESSRKVAAAADKTEAKDAAQKIADKLEASGSKIKIRLLEGNSSEVQVEIVDSSSNKVLRKIPQDEILKLSASIKKMSGLALDQPA